MCGERLKSMRPGYRLLAVIVALVAATGLLWAYPRSSPLSSLARHAAPRVLGLAAPATTPTPTITKPTYLVLLVVDGAKPDYFSVPNIPHIDALRKSGAWYTNAMAGILESETPSGHATIDSGSEPRQDGILSFSWAGNNNKEVSLFSESVVRAGLLERVMKAADSPTIAGDVHAADPQAQVVALSGYKYYAADALGGPNADAIMYFTTLANGTFGPTAIPGHMPPKSVLDDPTLISPNRRLAFTTENHLAMTLAAHTFQTMHQKVTLINLPDSDWPLGHPWGADGDRKDVVTMMQHLDSDLDMLENVYRKAGVLDRTLFVVTADHGFVTIKHQVPDSVINNAVTRAGTSVIYDTHHTASYVWIRDESKAGTIAADLAGQNNPYIQSIYYRVQTSAGSRYVRTTSAANFLTSGMESANQYLLNTFNSSTGPDIAVFYREGSVGTPASQKSWKGDHGGADWQAQHVPLLISGPGVRQGYVSHHPARLEDVAPTALHLLDIPSSDMNGLVLADALLQPTAQETVQQAALDKTLHPVIAALRRESTLEQHQ
jgi:hypothetical protein